MRPLILSLAIAAPILLVVLWPYGRWIGIGILAMSHGLLLIATLVPNVQWLGPVMTRFETDRREVWLTIDDGPTDDTPELLDLLDSRGVKVTFFVTGINARERHDRVLEILRRGHSVANHSETHPAGTFWCLPPRRIADEIESCNRILEEITGERPRWFRAPVGMKNPAVHPALRRSGMRLIGWSVRGFDTFGFQPEKVVDRIVPRVKPGAIVVMHQGRSWSAGTIERVIDALQQRGYSFVIPDDERLKT